MYQFTVRWLPNTSNGRGRRSWVIRILGGDFQAAARARPHVFIKASSVRSSWEQNQSVSQHCFALLLLSRIARPPVLFYWQFPWSWFSIKLSIHCAKLFLLLHCLTEQITQPSIKFLVTAITGPSVAQTQFSVLHSSFYRANWSLFVFEEHWPTSWTLLIRVKHGAFHHLPFL